MVQRKVNSCFYEREGVCPTKSHLMRLQIITLNDTVRLCGLQSAMKTDYSNPGADPVSRALAPKPCAPKAGCKRRWILPPACPAGRQSQPEAEWQRPILGDGFFQNYHQHLSVFDASLDGVFRSSHFPAPLARLWTFFHKQRKRLDVNWSREKGSGSL